VLPGLCSIHLVRRCPQGLVSPGHRDPNVPHHHLKIDSIRGKERESPEQQHGMPVVRVMRVSLEVRLWGLHVHVSTSKYI